uniref:Pentatricopeptide repeat-containing protein n=1 Tax=Tanacetum cinerariifolium TaxID=118510 RepID=A0A6L2LMK2_TANCI|nr:pentatricopeptide repeat-containing protein [Tanacetum cinerariifolium]
MWLLDYLSISTPSKDRYKTTPHSPGVIKSLIQVPRQGQVTHTQRKKTIIVDANKILTSEIQTHIKPWVEIICENVFCVGGYRDHVSACIFHMLYCIETSTQYNLAFFILKRMKRTRNKPKELLPYGMLLTRFFNYVVTDFPELEIDRYTSYDRVMYPLAPHYERKTRADHGTKRPHGSTPSSSPSTLNHPSSSHHIDENVDVDDEKSTHSNSSSSSQVIGSMSNVVLRVFSNLPHESQSLDLYQTEILNHQTKFRDEYRKGLRSIKKALKDLMKGSKK